MAIINSAQLKITLAKDRNGKLQGVAMDRAEAIFEDEVAKLKDEFDNHKVTQELDGGASADNISDTLRGGEAPENLYSFIGFSAGERPTDEIRKRLDSSDPDGPKLRYEGRDQRSPTFRFKVTAPKLERIYDATPIPWAEGMSWAQKIESYIPGFASFLPREGEGRSEGGVQAKGPDGELRAVRQAEYTPPKDGYLIPLFTQFLAGIKGSARSGGRRRDAGGRFTSF